MYGFRLTKNADKLEKVDFALNGWKMAVADNLPITNIFDQSGVNIGVVVGWAVCPKRQKLLTCSEVIRYDGGIERVFKQLIYPLTGKFFAFFSKDDQHRVYMDALGSLSVVFDSNSQLVGGTAADLMDEKEYQDRFDAQMYNSLEIQKDGWFPAGLTAHHGLERLMPNHFLDCKSWNQERHNYYSSSIECTPSKEKKLEDIYQVIQDSINGILNSNKNVSIALTGGGDSRMIMAAAKNLRDKVEFYTVSAPGGSVRSFDETRATELSSRYELNHVILPYVSATDNEAKEWDRRVGSCVITANRRMFPSVYPLKSRICIGGLGGEVGRRFLWPNARRPPPVNAIGIVDALKLPREPKLIQRVENWLENFPNKSPAHILDIAYIELRMGSWASVQSYANPNPVVISPLGSFMAIEAMLSLPAEYRENDGMVYGFIRKFWPEILSLPINRFGDLRDLTKIFPIIFQPKKVFRRARKFVRLGNR